MDKKHINRSIGKIHENNKIAEEEFMKMMCTYFGNRSTKTKDWSQTLI